MVRKILKQGIIYRAAGELFISSGVILACLLSIHLASEIIKNLVQGERKYLIVDAPISFDLPQATPLPTPTPAQIILRQPSATTRLLIPAINVNINVIEISPTKNSSTNKFIWETPAFAAGHYITSGNPTEGRNIVFSGHNNTLGEVFKNLEKLEIGDKIILITEDGEYRYRIQKKLIVPYLGLEEEGDARLQSYTAPQKKEFVTLISCWPYATNSHRIIIVAVPHLDEKNHEQ